MTATKEKKIKLAEVARRMTLRALRTGDAEYRAYARQAVQGISFKNSNEQVDCSY